MGEAFARAENPKKQEVNKQSFFIMNISLKMFCDEHPGLFAEKTYDTGDT